MGDALGEILSFAVGVAVSPVPIAAAIVMLFTPKAKTNGPSFLVGWILGLVVVGTIVLSIPGFDPGESEPSTTTGIIKGVLGLLMVAVAWMSWQKRPRTGETAEPPKWMAAIDTFTAVKSLGIGFLLSAVNPKNLLLTAGAAVSIASAGLATTEEFIVLFVFVAIAASTVAIPVIGYLIVGERADEAFSNAKDWLIQNNSVVMAVLLLVFGVTLVGDAIAILF